MGFVAGLSAIWIVCCIIEAVGNAWGGKGVGLLFLCVFAMLWIGNRLMAWDETVAATRSIWARIRRLVR